MVKNHKLAKSISDAAWSQFAQWLQYLGKVYGKTVVAVAPQYTSQDCSTCGNTVKKSLSVRTHVCGCGTVLDRDHNAALNILAKALRQVGIEINTAGHAGIVAYSPLGMKTAQRDVVQHGAIAANAFGQNDLYSLVVTSMSKPTG
jgi:putative transposase